ncbi:MAG: energy transducer TonB, partial [Elusimicrobiota bacterium]
HEANLVVISEGEFVEPPPPPSALPQQAPPPKAKTSVMDFLKMTLPVFKKPASTFDEIEAPKPQSQMAELPKSERITLDKKTFESQPALDLARRNAADANLQDLAAAKTQRPDRTMAQLSDSPIKLEEVGRRAPRSAPQAIELARHRGGGLADIKTMAQSRPATAPPQGALVDASAINLNRAQSRPQLPGLPGSGGIALTKAGGLQEGRAPVIATPPAALPKHIESPQQSAPEKPKKAMEISGPLSQRKIVRSKLPAYPQWAKDKLISATVVLQFSVSAEGKVRPEIKISRTCGYRELDTNAIEALKQWLFEPIQSGGGDQWGFITFNYLLE